MGYSQKQKLFADLMLKRIGLTDPTDIEAYLVHLERLYGRMSYTGYSWRYSVSECIELLKQEIDLKNFRNTIKKIEPKQVVSSTDLANYDFCPASFVINNSFRIENPSGEEFTEMGKLLHEQLLAARTKWHKEDGVNYSSSDIDVAAVQQSRLVFVGHADNEKKFTKDNWVGIPDYIFQDSENKYFVVEEKFHKKRDPLKASWDEIASERYSGNNIDVVAEQQRADWAKFKGYFFSNHIVQLTSYIKNIKEYPIEYGYLLYWYYDLDSGGEPYVHKVVTKKIILNAKNEELYLNAMSGIQNLKKSKTAVFNVNKLNMRKCAGCVVNKYCGHKTKRFNELPFPYNQNFLSLYYAPFPEELKKSIP